VAVANRGRVGLASRVPLSHEYRRTLSALLAGGVLALWVCGCASNKVNWESRVGRTTYDEIVLEMGPPDKSATLSDGSSICEWVTQRGRAFATASPTVYAFRRPYSYGAFGPVVDVTETPDTVIRLTFGQDKHLSGWKKLYR